MVFAEPDPALRECLERLPKRQINNDEDIANLINDAFEVGDDCRSKLGATWKSIDETRATVEAFNRDQSRREE